CDELRDITQFILEQEPALEDALDFLTQGTGDEGVGTYGAAWNRALLLSGNKDFIKVDDDVLLRYCSRQSDSAKIKVGVQQPDKIFISENTAWEEYVAPDNQGVLSGHARFLGGTLKKAVDIIGESSLSDESITGQSFSALTNINADSPVLLTTSGNFGDPGIASNRWLLDLKGDERLQVVESEVAYSRAKTSRYLITAQSQHTFRTDFSLISTVTGVGNSYLLPPYFPMFRNEDFLFGRMIQFLYPSAVLLDLPFFVPHLPLEKREWDAEGICKPEQMGFLYFLGIYISKRKADWGSRLVDVRYDALVALFQNLASLDNAALLKIVRDEMSNLVASVVKEANENLKGFPDAPEYWKSDIKNNINANLKYLTHIEHEFLTDLSYAGDIDQQVALFKMLLSKYTQALKDWRKIRTIIEGYKY
ncbi:MAG: hypothetical protein MI754_01220, partial [Chromatiales bacterium]|nr:hypothetical protein [Chromatiales bacterium]